MIVLIQLFYLVLSIGLTVLVGWVLFRNGRVFLLEAFRQDAVVADAVNRLMLTGFYLLNIGAVSLFLSFFEQPKTDATALVWLTSKLGLVMLVLGALHYANMINFARMRSRARRHDRERAEDAALAQAGIRAPLRALEP